MRSILILILVFCINYRAYSLTERNFKREWKHQKEVTFKYAKPIAAVDFSFFYVTCLEEKSPVQLNCQVYRETPVDPWRQRQRNHEHHKRQRRHKHTRKNSKCQLNLRNSEDKSELPILASLERFPSGDQAIVVSWERPKDSQYQVHALALSIVKFSDCSIRQLRYSLDIDRPVLLSNLIVYPDGFDVIVSNVDLCRSANSSTCRLSHDLEGRRLAVNPSPFDTNFDRAQTFPVLSDSSRLGFYVTGTDVAAWKFRAMHLGPTGSALNLMSANGVGDPRQLIRASAVNHELLLVCLDGKRKAHCGQFDVDAQVKLNATLELPTAKVRWMAGYNIKEGEALLASGSCGPVKCVGIKLHRLKVSGNYEELVNLTNFEFRCYGSRPDDFSAEIMENGLDLCFYFACNVVNATQQSTTPKPDLNKVTKYFAKCIPKTELKL